MFKETKFEIQKTEENGGEILSNFSEQEQEEIERKRKILSSLAYFIGKDFQIPVKLNRLGGGWNWDFKNNIIGVDPKDLLEKPIDYLRFVISHEGGHRRISRADFIPTEEWSQPGFSFMMNSIEDPRDNNFVAENYPKFKEQMKIAYKEDMDIERRAKEKAQNKLGYQPRFLQAGFEYMKQWFREVQGQEIEIDENLSDDVQQVLEKTLGSAQDSWWRYPSRREADDPKYGESTIKKYAQVSYEINRDKIWPEFKKLVEEDMKDQNMQELMQDMQQQQSQEEQGVSQELKDKLTEKEQKELEEAINKALEEANKDNDKNTKGKGKEGEGEDKEDAKTKEGEGKDGKKDGKQGKSIDLDSLSEELKQKIKDYINSLPKDKKEELDKKAKASIKDFEKDISDELQGKLSENPEQKDKREQEEKENSQQGDQKSQGGAPVRTGVLRSEPLDTENLRLYRERLRRETNKDENIYEQYRREVLVLIDKLEADLRHIFVERTATKWKSGFKSGKRINIKKRLQEKGQQISAMESKSWQRRERPDKKDYAISLLVDLSGSMREKSQERKKIDETFKSVIVLAEALNRIGLNVEIVGFNDDLYEYQNFGQPMSKQIRDHMGGMFKEVEDSCCTSCGNEHSETDLGWATKMAAERLSKQKSVEKLMIVLTDGKAAESSKHPRKEFNLDKVKQEILDQTNIMPIDIGNITGKTVEQIIEVIKKILEQMV